MAERLTGFDYCFTRCMEPGADKQEIREDCSLYKVCLERQIFEKLQHYEDLEEQGRLIELPCKIGDTVWDIKWWDDTTETRVIDGKTYFRRVMKHKVTKSKFKLFDYDNFGKTVFLTREEAETALKGAEE